MDTPPTITVNGELHPADAGILSVADRSFRFGDGFFQTIAVAHGVPYQWEFHRARLQEAANLLSVPLSAQLEAWVKAQLQANPMRHGHVRITVSRGVGSKGYAADNPTPVTIIESSEAAAPTLSNCTAYISDYRRYPANYLPGHLKWNMGLNNSLALAEAAEHGCDNALQLTPEGMLCEAANANLFWLKAGILFTPSLLSNCLRGSTREAILRLSPWPMEEMMASPEALHGADAVWLCNTRLMVANVTHVAPMDLSFTGGGAEKIFSLLERDRLRYAEAHIKDWKY